MAASRLAACELRNAEIEAHRNQVNLDQAVGACAADEEGGEQNPEYSCLGGVAQRTERGCHDRRGIRWRWRGQWLRALVAERTQADVTWDDRASASKRRRPRPPASRTSGASAIRQPICSVRLAKQRQEHQLSGRGTGGENADSPARAVPLNHRAETVAPSTSAVMPVPMPTTTPHSNINCQTWCHRRARSPAP